MEKTFLLYLSVHWGDLIEPIKKICHIHFKEVTLFFGSRVEATLCDVHSEMKRNESYQTMLSSGTVYYAVHVDETRPVLLDSNFDDVQ